MTATRITSARATVQAAILITPKQLKSRRMKESIEQTTWLCRNCNSLVERDIDKCPCCGADRPEEGTTEPQPNGISEVVTRDNYTNAGPKPKSKYILREAVLVNAADITLIFGLFATFGALIAPIVVDFGIDAPMLWAVCAGVVIFSSTMVSWALLRTIAEISRMLRNRE